MSDFLRRRHCKMRHSDALRIHSLEDSTNHPVFATRVHGLQYDQDFLLMLGVELFLKLLKLFIELLRLLLLHVCLPGES